MNNQKEKQNIIIRVLAALMIIVIFLSVIYPIFADEVAENYNSEEQQVKVFTAFENAKNGVAAEMEEGEEVAPIDPDEIVFDETLKCECYPDPNTNMGKIYTYITETMELNRAVAFGILAHIRRESRFTSTAYNPSGYYGLCQWGGNRYTNLINWCDENGYDYTTLDGQVRFMEHELNGPYSKVLDSLKECENTADGAYDAAYVFGMRYEVSGLANARIAGYSAMEMFNREP